MFNQVTLIGNLGADPEVRRTNSGDPIANLRVATTERWKNQSGERQERTEWHTVSVFGPLAEIVERYLSKGSKVHVSGQLRTRKWQDRDGNDRFTTEVVLQGPRAVLNMLDSKGEGQRGGGGESRSKHFDDLAYSSDQAALVEREDPDTLDDDIPF